MFSKFVSLDTDKQEHIINVAIKEFVRKGYKSASTNEIVKAAGISKGLLFHYFNSKKDLFLFLYDYSLEIFMHEFMGRIDLNQTDILLRLRQMASLKIEIINKHPDLFDFMLLAVAEQSDVVRPALDQKNRTVLSSGYETLFQGLDTSRFKIGIDPNRAINTIFWTLEGLRNQEQAKVGRISFDAEYYRHILSEMDMYLDLFRTCFYK